MSRAAVRNLLFVVVVAVLVAALQLGPETGSVTTAQARAQLRRVPVDVKPVVVRIPATTTTTLPVHDVTIPAVENGVAPLITRIPTTEPVVFLTIDDGATKRPSDLALIRELDLKASIYLADSFIDDAPAFFGSWQDAGFPIQNHTLHHRDLRRLGYDEQVAEICGGADRIESLFGRRPTLFRPPGGSFNTTTQRAAAACGMRAVVNWIAAVNDGRVDHQLGSGLRAGDIVLMHFRPTFEADLRAFVSAASAAGLRTDLLENWLPRDQTPTSDRIRSSDSLSFDSAVS